jgi:quercetin dioxygenase-like cupin family protein
MPETTRQPEGAYPKPAKVHYIDLEAESAQLVNLLPGRRRQTKSLARESGVSVIMMAMEGGDALEEHTADGVVIINVVEGHATIRADGETFDLREGELVMLQPNVSHDVRAEEQSIVLLTVTGGAD